MPLNIFKQNLAAGTVQYGGWCSVGDAVVTEIMATAGFDWLVIDGEHGPNHLRSMLAQLQAAQAYPVAPLVRIPNGEATLIKQVLDAGFPSVLVPMVETAEQAEMLVRATRYPPAGIRGVSGSRASRWGAVDNYFGQANDQVCLVVQIETKLGVQNLDEIAAVDGVDGLFIGPSDLAASMGHLGEPGHPDVKAAVIEAIGRIRQSGKAPGVLTMAPNLISDYRDAGATFIAVGVDTYLLANAARSAVTNLQN